MVQKRIVLHFSAEQAEKPIIYKLIKDYDLMVNILRAEIKPNKEGFMFIELAGDFEHFQRGLEYLKEADINVETLQQDVVWNQEKCVQCGACTALCPTNSLYMKRPQMQVYFDEDKCIVCGMCVKICPAKAVTAKF